jgi:aspartate aminotransferase-like enzyme
VIVPGSGTFGMEAVARQFANNEKCLVLRNGWFSYRWTQIFDLANITKDVTVIKGRQLEDSAQGVFAPAPIEEVVAFIKKEKPAVVFAPHVETSAGIILPDDYLKSVGEAVRSVNGLFVLDCIASGAMWVDMKACHVDVLITAPQKGWSSSPCCALIALGDRARERIESTQSSSFSMDLKKWLQIMEAYEKGGHVYHTTMATDALKVLRNVMKETQSLGFAALKEKQIELGAKVRNLLVSKGYDSVAAKGFQAPGVVVSYTKDPDIQSGKKFIALGLQTAAGVPLQCDERPDFRTFRIGLFGLEKLAHVDRTVGHLEAALEKITETEAQTA